MDTTSSLCKIVLDGKIHSSLDWSKEIDLAHKAISEGTPLFWYLDLGLFKELKAPLSDKLQFSSLSLAIDQFYDKIWTQFGDKSCAVSIYQGSGRFDQLFEWDQSLLFEYEGWKSELNEMEFTESEGKQIFAAHRAFDFFELLSNSVPEDPLFSVEIDGSEITSLFLLGQTLSSEISQNIKVILVNGMADLQQDSPIGIVLPEISHVTKKGQNLWEKVSQEMVKRKIAFRILSETFIINKWEGLDFLLVDPQTLSPSGPRKLQGFSAAGGEVITLTEDFKTPCKNIFKLN